mmetsp:Transcript_17790/g.53599  ORF Transcript_17790/g.53599 Transcript_17790/m.53599 type:complete len:281 (+) Transcript_17790:5095-5937(+)
MPDAPSQTLRLHWQSLVLICSRLLPTDPRLRAAGWPSPLPPPQWHITARSRRWQRSRGRALGPVSLWCSAFSMPRTATSRTRPQGSKWSEGWRVRSRRGASMAITSSSRPPPPHRSIWICWPKCLRGLCHWRDCLPRGAPVWLSPLTPPTRWSCLSTFRTQAPWTPSRPRRPGTVCCWPPHQWRPPWWCSGRRPPPPPPALTGPTSPAPPPMPRLCSTYGRATWHVLNWHGWQDGAVAAASSSMPLPPFGTGALGTMLSGSGHCCTGSAAPCQNICQCPP